MSGSRLLRTVILPLARSSARNGSTHAVEPSKIGAREIVGYGYNGEANYQDKFDFPFPAVRFRPETADIKALREKEKGDWKNLTVAEKKALYRASYCQTFAELDAPTGEWKSILGLSLAFASLTIWVFMGIKAFIIPVEFPESFSEASRQAQLKRYLAFRANPIEGLASKYDYEKNDWKK